MKTQLHPLILIPARYGSTRFPGKALADIQGKPMVQHVYEKASKLTSDVYVATDDPRIAQVVRGFGGQALMTSPEHQSGTDRCNEAYTHILKKGGESFDVVVNLQGDEPFVRPEQIASLIACFELPETQIATLIKMITNAESLFNPNHVKVVCTASGKAMYFSRSPIPYCRGRQQEAWLSGETPYYKHLGMYAFRPEVLRAVTALPQSPLEKAESLEQLRWLENGYSISVALTEYESIGIDTPEDLLRLNLG